MPRTKRARASRVAVEALAKWMHEANWTYETCGRRNLALYEGFGWGAVPLETQGLCRFVARKLIESPPACLTGRVDEEEG